MAIVREHLARKGLGLHNDLQNESSIVGNLVTVLMMEKYGSAGAAGEWIPKMLGGHGPDRVRADRTAARFGRHVDGDDGDPRRRRVGDQRREVLEHRAAPRHARLHLRPHLGRPGDGRGITCFIVPTDSPGFEIEEFMWTFNMPTDHAHVRLTEVRGPQRRRSSATRARAA